MSEKPKLALYWAASCGGCEIAVVELGANLLKVAEAFDIVFWPVALDFKYKDVEAMEDGSIALTLFNGAIRTTENEEMAHLLRAKSKALVAFGSCATEGCIPGLSNFTTAEDTLARAFLESPSTDNPDKVLPQLTFKAKEGELTIPDFYNTVKTLAQTVEVDYFVPGCPPVAKQIWNVMQVVMSGKLPPKGSVIGANSKTVCDECDRVKEDKKVKRFFRPHLIIAEDKRCLLEQGLICAGPATRGGCGALCLKAKMPCRGCYGPTDEVVDQGAKLLSAVASIMDSQDEAEIREIVDQIVDPAGTFYRFSLPNSLLHRVKVNKGR